MLPMAIEVLDSAKKVGLSSDRLARIRPFFEDYYTIQFDNYAVDEQYLHRHQVIGAT